MESDDSKGRPGRRRRRLLLFVALLLVGGVAWAAWWQLSGQFHESTENAQVAGNRLTVMPQITGTVTAVRADDTDHVQRGDLLVQLDDADARLAAAAAEAALAEAVREVTMLVADRGRAAAAVELANARLARANADLERRRGLIVRRSISAEELNHAELAASTARASVEVARRQLAVAQSALGGTPLREHPRLRQAVTGLRRAYLDVERCRVLAPAAGQVAQRSVQVGQQVTPASRLLDVVPLDDVWVDVNFKEGQLANLRIGQAVRLGTDLYGDRVTFTGRVAGIGAGTGSVFSLLPPQNATGNWIKILQRVPVRVSIDRDSLGGRALPLGISVSATVDTQDRSGELVTSAAAPDAARYATDVYAERLQDIDARVAQRVDEALHAAQGS
jgi:membrane fusion protein (multidrug efflux system)